jgi:cell division septal protein FtsQ
MIKVYKIFLLLIVFIFLTTYNPAKFDFFFKKDFLTFKIKNIEVKNNYIIDKMEILSKLKNIYKNNIFFIKRNDLEKYLSSIDFLEKIEVKKKYPDTLIIKVFETKPLAVLFKESDKYLLDSSSNLIDFSKNSLKRELPSVFGDGAEKNFVSFFSQLKKNNFPTDKIKSYHYFQIGRWDLLFSKDKIIKLPADNVTLAINQTIKLLNKKEFNNFNVIDLRVDGKIVVK